MFDTVYIETAVHDHPQTSAILKRFKGRNIIECNHYGELFNNKQQNFRLQKQRPALILANKQGKRVLPAPPGYGIGAKHNYYFSHMLNCVYDCRYCFLQGMYRSAHTVLFVNYESFVDELIGISKQHQNDMVHMFSGYDGDSLALEPLSGFASHFIPALRDQDNLWLELRTKSTQVRQLLNMEAWQQCVVAFSFTPQNMSMALEHNVPGIEQRLDAMHKLQQAGWPLGIRLDPLIYSDDFEQQYEALLQTLFSKLDPQNIHSISFGPFRMPEKFFQRMSQLYPVEPLFAQNMDKNDGMISYSAAMENDMRDTCQQLLLQHVSQEQLFPCVN